MKRILIFSLQYYPLVGGAEVAIKEITDRIPDIEFDMVTLRFSADAPAVERIGNVTVYRVGKGKKNLTFAKSFSPLFYVSKVLFIPLAAVKGAQLAKTRPYDAAWAMMTYMLFPIVLMRMRGIRLPYLLTLQEGDPFEHVFERWHIRVFSPLLFYGIRHASAVQAISTFLGTWVERCGYTRKIAIIPNGVDLTKFTAPMAPTAIADKKRELGKQAGEVWLVTTSRLVYKNAIDDVIRALPLLSPTVHFAVFGIGPLEDELRQLAISLQVADRVRFCGAIPYDAIPLALAACDIFIRPSRSEGMGNSFIEAMAAGLPVIATQEGGIADFLFDAKRNPKAVTTGWAVDANAPEQIKEAVQSIVAHPEEVAVITQNAKKLVTEKYGWDTVARDMRQVFSELKQTPAIQVQ